MNQVLKYMDIREFRELGFLQEANRQFFHPLGLALEVTINRDGAPVLGGIWDYRENPEGITFTDLTDGDSARKQQSVARERERHSKAREDLFGNIIQPIGKTI